MSVSPAENVVSHWALGEGRREEDSSRSRAGVGCQEKGGSFLQLEEFPHSDILTFRSCVGCMLFTIVVLLFSEYGVVFHWQAQVFKVYPGGVFSASLHPGGSYASYSNCIGGSGLLVHMLMYVYVLSLI